MPDDPTFQIHVSKPSVDAASMVFADYKAAMDDRQEARAMLTDTLLQLHTNAEGDSTSASVTRNAAADFVMLLRGTAVELSKLAAAKPDGERAHLDFMCGVLARDADRVHKALFDFNAYLERPVKRGWFSRK